MLNRHHFTADHQRQVAKLEKRMQGLRNEMEFVEILAQFWPWPNMADKVERLQAEIKRLDHQVHRVSYLKAG
jgi:hypothetical protein